MKKIIFIAILSLGLGKANAQINAGSGINNTPQKNIFLDASGFNQYDANVGKGLNFPRTDLTTFRFDLSDLGRRQYFRSAFDGMVVYNTGTGQTGADARTQGIQVDVTPGFYYFSNPNGNDRTKDVSQGKWVRIGGSDKKEVQKITETESVSKIVGDKTVYVVKGQFELTTGDNGTRITLPNGMTSLYSINIFRKEGATSHLVGTSLYTYKLTAAAPAKNIIFGSGIISTAYPAGTYEYVLEYIK